MLDGSELDADVPMTDETTAFGIGNRGASNHRRKQNANFLSRARLWQHVHKKPQLEGCVVQFSVLHYFIILTTLLGHMRSHNEERPFQCRWPGCGMPDSATANATSSCIPTTASSLAKDVTRRLPAWISISPSFLSESDVDLY